eukprot:766527-Hanusia_phi.AAC.6
MASSAFAHDTGIDSGVWDNPFDNGSFGTQYISNVNELPQCEMCDVLWRADCLQTPGPSTSLTTTVRLIR